MGELSRGFWISTVPPVELPSSTKECSGAHSVTYLSICEHIHVLII